jgi:hypothetical protein
MQPQESPIPTQCERIQVTIDTTDASRRIKICLESHEPCLGWYRAASLSIPLHQLPLLEQALESMRTLDAAEAPVSEKIIPGFAS